MAEDRELPKENVYSMWLDEDRSEKTGLRASITVAIIIHSILFAITFPALSTPEHEIKESDKLFVVQTPRFKKPPPPPEREIPRPQTKKVPIPDPEPDDPDPYVVDEPEVPELEIDYDADLVVGIPEAPPAPEPEDRVYIGGGEVKRPERIHYVTPQYTEIARRARIEGMVILQAIIDKQGSVRDLKVLKGLSMGLTEEAEKAVRQWRYRPSTVDGRPVHVLLTVTVNFELQ